MFLDLDRFKNVNDTLGHQFGDQLLREVAARLQACAREADTVARLGGDEFVVMLESLDGTGTRRVAERILAAIGAPFHIDGQELFLGVSIGIAVAPHDGDDPNTLLRKADAAMYLAKERAATTSRPSPATWTTASRGASASNRACAAPATATSSTPTTSRGWTSAPAASSGWRR